MDAMSKFAATLIEKIKAATTDKEVQALGKEWNDEYPEYKVKNYTSKKFKTHEERKAYIVNTIEGMAAVAAAAPASSPTHSASAFVDDDAEMMDEAPASAAEPPAVAYGKKRAKQSCPATPESSDTEGAENYDEVVQKMWGLKMENVELSTEKAELEARIKAMEIELESMRKHASDDRHAEMQTEIAHLKKALHLCRNITRKVHQQMALEVNKLNAEIAKMRVAQDAEAAKASEAANIDTADFDAFLDKHPVSTTTDIEEYFDNIIAMYNASKNV